MTGVQTCALPISYVDTGLNVVHVDDVARGHVLAFERGVAGERYILGGENLDLVQILNLIDELTGVRRRRLPLPHHLIMPVAWGMERWARISGREPLVTLDGVRMARKKMFFSSAKAVRVLGYSFRPAREALRDAIEWFRNNNYG